MVFLISAGFPMVFPISAGFSHGFPHFCWVFLPVVSPVRRLQVQRVLHGSGSVSRIAFPALLVAVAAVLVLYKHWQERCMAKPW
jgi:hypothetical protein